MLPEIYAEFSISGDELNPNEITQLLAISPTRSWLKGELGMASIPRKESAWCLTTPAKRGFEIEEHVNALIEIIDAKIPLIREIAMQKELYLLVDVVVYMVDTTPAICLDSKMMLKLGELGANFEVDIITISNLD